MDGYTEALARAVRADLEAEVQRLRAQVLRLAEEKRQLEQLCKELHEVLYLAPIGLDEAHQGWYKRYDVVQAQYKALLEQETNG